MDFPQAVRSVFSQFRGFSGRASRSEYWYFMAFLFLMQFVLLVFALIPDTSLIFWIGYLLIALPAIALTSRRLHDVDKSFIWVLAHLVPFGSFYLFYLSVIKGTSGPNRFGADPLAPTDNQPIDEQEELVNSIIQEITLDYASLPQVDLPLGDVVDEQTKKDRYGRNVSKSDQKPNSKSKSDFLKG